MYHYMWYTLTHDDVGLHSYDGNHSTAPQTTLLLHTLQLLSFCAHTGPGKGCPESTTTSTLYCCSIVPAPDCS